MKKTVKYYILIELNLTNGDVRFVSEEKNEKDSNISYLN